MRIRDWYVLPVYTRFFKDFKSNSQFLLSSLELLEVNSFLCHGVWGKLPLQPMHTLWGTIAVSLIWIKLDLNTYFSVSIISAQNYVLI